MPGLSRVGVTDLYEALFNLLDENKLGYGSDIQTPGQKAHWPSAFALVSSAETARYAINPDEAPRQHVRQCAKWLVANIGCATSGAPCWGVPYARKTLGAVSPVAKGTAFCVPTSHVIQALSEAAISEMCDEEERAEFREAAVGAARYFAENCFDACDDGIAFWYSPLRQHSFHVTNATAMMLGQLQRASRLTPSGSFLASQADKAVQYLLERREFDDRGFGWLYFGDKLPSGKKNRYNDLLHEAFVCHGLLDYKRFGGALGSRYTEDELYLTLARFYRDGAFHEFPGSEKRESRRKRWARLWALGHALYVTSRLERSIKSEKGKSLSAILFEQIRDHYFDGKDLYYRPNEEIVNNRVREVGHVLLGLGQYQAKLAAERGRRMPLYDWP